MAESTNIQEVYGATISGTLFELPAGGFDMAAGIFRRTESASFTADGVWTANISRIGASANVAGKYSVNEGYVEIFVPIIDQGMDIPFVDKLSFGLVSMLHNV